IGPTFVPSSRGSPTLTWLNFSLTAVKNSSFILAGTNVLVPALHTCPVLLTTLPVAALAAPSISASSKIIYGDLPPNSNDTFLKSSAAFFIILAPVGPDPVKDIILTFGCSLSGFPTPWPSPFTKLNTPLGTPTLSNISAKIIAANGVSSDGFNTTGLPAAKAAANFNEVWLVGKFHGVLILQHQSLL